MSLISEMSISNVTLTYCVSTMQPPALATWWTIQVDGLETSSMRDAMKLEYHELENEKYKNRLTFSSLEPLRQEPVYESEYIQLSDILTKTNQYINSVANLGYRLVGSTCSQDYNNGIVVFQYSLQK